MTTPKRIKLSRKEGYRIPAGAVRCCRPGKWGNPYTVGDWGRDESMAMYADLCRERLRRDPNYFSELRGKDLGCFCRLDQPCHVDILLRIANEEVRK